LYESDSLRLLHQITSRWPVNAIACHPTLPLAAVVTGSYDGGRSYEGELLLLDLTTGTSVSLLAHPREVRRISWRDSQTLDLVLAIPCDEEEKRFATTSLACSIRRNDWDCASDMMPRMPYGEMPVPDEPRTDPAAAVSKGYSRERTSDPPPCHDRRGVQSHQATQIGESMMIAA
jgi:hypothetical protein